MSGPDSPPAAIQVRIYGRVQGVWFRVWTVTEATDLGLTGWVRNCADGSVEALFVGLPADVEMMIAKCHEGPPSARVDDVVHWGPSKAPLEDTEFRQLSSA
jgi:acylphosphatase